MDSSLGSSVGAITLFVEDLPSSRTFYREVFGREPIFDDEVSSAFDFGNMVVNLLATSAAGELVEPGAVAAAGGGSRCQLTVEVDDVHATCAELADKGVALQNGPLDRPWGLRTASFTDPAGHLWEIAQGLPRDQA